MKFKLPWIEATWIVYVRPNVYEVESIYWDGKYWPTRGVVTITMKESKWERQ